MFGVRQNLSECLGKALIYKLLFNHILAQTRHVYTTLFFLRTFLREFARKKKIPVFSIRRLQILSHVTISSCSYSLVRLL